MVGEIAPQTFECKYKRRLESETAYDGNFGRHYLYKTEFTLEEVKQHENIMSLVRNTDMPIDELGFYYLSGKEGSYGLAGLEIIQKKDMKPVLNVGFSSVKSVDKKFKKIFKNAPKDREIESLNPFHPSLPGNEPMYAGPGFHEDYYWKYFAGSKTALLGRKINTKELSGWLEYITKDLPPKTFFLNHLALSGPYEESLHKNIVDMDGELLNHIDVKAAYKDIDFHITKYRKPEYNLSFSLPHNVGEGQINQLMSLLKIL